MRVLLIAGASLILSGSVRSAESPNDALEQIRALLPSQSHAMMDVEYNFANLWFAGRAGNWPLATFYLNESRSHVQWTVRLRPVRKLASGQDLDLMPLLDAFEHAGVDAVRATLDHKDSKAFQVAYRSALGQCLACHVAAEKPFLRPDVPREPASKLIRMQPAP